MISTSPSSSLLPFALSVATAPFLVGIVGIYCLEQLVTDLDASSGSLLGGDWLKWGPLPILPFP